MTLFGTLGYRPFMLDLLHCGNHPEIHCPRPCHGCCSSGAGDRDSEAVRESVGKKSDEITNHCFLEYQPLTTLNLHV
jgi:hypothetical protein